MKSRKFEDGRKFHRLERQISRLYLEILNEVSENSESQIKDLRVILKEAFKEYISLAHKYIGSVEKSEIQFITKKYEKAIGEPQNYKTPPGFHF